MHQIISCDRPTDIDGMEATIRRIIHKNPKAQFPILKFLNARTYIDRKVFNDNLEYFIEKAKRDTAGRIALLAVGEQLLVEPQELIDARISFSDNYNSHLPVEDVWITVGNLQDNIHSAKSQSRVAYKFIHRYNAQHNWFLTARRYELENISAPEIPGTPYNMSYKKPAFDVTTIGRKTATNSGLSEIPVGSGIYRDLNYLKNITSNYDIDERVWSVNFPAREFNLLYTSNLQENDIERDLRINFAPVSYNLPSRPLNPFPHGIILYMSDSAGHPRLQEGNIVAGAYLRGKGANMDTLSPPYHSVYLWPQDLYD